MEVKSNESGSHSAELLPERLRQLRALEILEHLCTPAARELLATLSKGNPHVSLTRAARAAAERWQEIIPCLHGALWNSRKGLDLKFTPRSVDREDIRRE